MDSAASRNLDGPGKTSGWVEADLAKLRNGSLAIFTKPTTISIAYDAASIGKPSKEFCVFHQFSFQHDANVLLPPRISRRWQPGRQHLQIGKSSQLQLLVKTQGLQPKRLEGYFSRRFTLFIVLGPRSRSRSMSRSTSRSKSMSRSRSRSTSRCRSS